MSEENEAVNKTAKPQAAHQEQKNILLGSISYSSDEDYENFLAKLDINQAMFVLIASANFCQSKGVFNLDESELVARAIKTIKKNSAQAQTDEPVASEESNS